MKNKITKVDIYFIFDFLTSLVSLVAGITWASLDLRKYNSKGGGLKSKVGATGLPIIMIMMNSIDDRNFDPSENLIN